MDSATQNGSELGIFVRVTGDIIPYAFANDQTGEEIGLVHLRVPGDVVSVNVEPSVARRMQEGERWTVEGLAIVRKKKGALHIATPFSMKRVSQTRAAGGPTIDFGDDASGGNTSRTNPVGGAAAAGPSNAAARKSA